MAIRIVSRCAEALGVSADSLRRIAESAPYRYKVFTIPKRRAGEVRVVAQPAREVKALQRTLTSFMQEGVQISRHATAYRRSMSIRTNASVHVGAAFLLKLDFSNFFPSISIAEVNGWLQRRYGPNISDAELRFIGRAVTWHRDRAPDLTLCIGAPSSPFLSNALLFDFDEEVGKLSRHLGVRYTRYSDDLTFSAECKEPLLRVESMLGGLLANHFSGAVQFNDRKRILVSRSRRLTVTGLCLTTQGTVSIGRERKRAIRSGVFRLLNGQLSLEETLSLKGEVAFAKSIEPNFIVRLVGWYGPRVRQFF